MRTPGSALPPASRSGTRSACTPWQVLAGVELGEDRGHAAVHRRVADPFLARAVVGRVDHELAGGRIEARRRCAGRARWTRASSSLMAKQPGSAPLAASRSQR